MHKRHYREQRDHNLYNCNSVICVCLRHHVFITITTTLTTTIMRVKIQLVYIDPFVVGGVWEQLEGSEA